MSSTPTSDTPRKRLPILHKSMLSLFVALATAEIFFRVDDALADPPRTTEFYLPVEQSETLYTTHPYLPSILRPGFTIKPVPGPESYATRINNLGMRGRDMKREKPPGVFRILCVGGSTTYGTGTSDSRYSYPAQLEKMLNDSTPEGVRFEVANCGVPGYCTSDSLINFQLRLLDLDPDAILIYHAANDSRPVQARGFLSDYSHIRVPWKTQSLSGPERFMLRSWRTYARLTRGTNPDDQLRSMSSHIMIPGYRELHVPSNLGVPQEGVDAFIRNVRSIVDLARSRDIEAIVQTFATCPKRYREGNEHFFETISKMNDGLRIYAAESEVPIVEVAERLHDKSHLFDDWMHLNDKGSGFHAQLIFEALHEQELFGLTPE